MHLLELFQKQVDDLPDHDAIVSGIGPTQRRVTYRQLHSCVHAVARQLKADGLQTGERICLLQPLSIELYIYLLALWANGAAAVLLDPGSSRRHALRCLESITVDGVIGPAKMHLLRLLLLKPIRSVKRAWYTSGWFPGLSHLPNLEMIDRLPDDVEIDVPAMDDAECAALVTFTSGSTGVPKVAVRSHAFLAAQFNALRKAVDLQSGEVDLVTLPVFLLANLGAGTKSVLADWHVGKNDLHGCAAVAEQLINESVTRCTASPTFFQNILKGKVDVSRFNKVYLGGAPVHRSLLDRLQKTMPKGTVTVVYGSTEAEPIAHLNWQEADQHIRARMSEGGGLPVGFVVDDLELRVVGPLRQAKKLQTKMTRSDFDSLTCPRTVPGEIWVNGPHVLKGYANGRGDHETKVNVEGIVWHRTGDAGYLDESGLLWLLGRASEVVVDKAGVVSPFAVEAAADGIPGLKRCAFLSYKGLRLLVYETSGQTDLNIEQNLRKKLNWLTIDRYLKVDVIPLDKRHQAKVDYPALRHLLSDQDLV